MCKAIVICGWCILLVQTDFINSTCMSSILGMQIEDGQKTEVLCETHTMARSPGGYSVYHQDKIKKNLGKTVELSHHHLIVEYLCTYSQSYCICHMY